MTKTKRNIREMDGEQLKRKIRKYQRKLAAFQAALESRVQPTNGIFTCKPVADVQVGDYVDACDTVCKWRTAKVIAVRSDGQLLIHYFGFSADRFDEYLPCSSPRLAIAGTRVGPTVWRVEVGQIVSYGGESVTIRKDAGDRVALDNIMAYIMKSELRPYGYVEPPCQPKIDDYVDAYNEDGQWQPAKVIGIDVGKYDVHTFGTSSDEDGFKSVKAAGSMASGPLERVEVGQEVDFCVDDKWFQGKVSCFDSTHCVVSRDGWIGRQEDRMKVIHLSQVFPYGWVANKRHE